MSYYKRLKTDLDGAAAAGIITPEQAGKVWDRSYSERPLAGLKAAHWIGAAAGLFIALGLILITASNWDKIGEVTKMGAFLLAFAGIGEAAMRLEGKPAGTVLLEIVWFFMPILGIGLYAQIFNLSGDPVRPFLVWAALSAPLAALSKRPLVAYLTAILLFGTLYYGTLGHGSMLALAAPRYDGIALPLWHWAAALLVLAGGVALFPGGRLGLPLGASAVWLFAMLAADTAIRLRSEALMLLAGMSLAALWLSWSRRPDGGKSGLATLAWVASVYALTFFWHYRGNEYYGSHTDTAAGAAVAWLLFAGALSTVLLKKQTLLPEGRTETWLAKGLLAAPVLCAFLMFDASQGSARIMAVIANLVLAAYGVGCITGGSRTSDEKLINRGVMVITLVAVTRFIDIFGNLLRSGVAFIVTGLAFAALAYAVNKGRKALIESIKK